MGRASKFMVLTVAMLVIIALPAAAKEGFYLGINVLINDINGEVNDPEWITSGNGHGLRGGYGLNRHLALEAGIWRSDHVTNYNGQKADMQAGTIDLKVNFPITDSHIEPYLLIGAGRYMIEQSGSAFYGKGGRIGAGMDIYLFPKLSLNIGLTHNNITFTQSGQDVNGRITTMDFGLSYHFI